MKQMIRSAATAAAITVTGLLGTAAPTQAYPVDCAILLCLAGGWPASAPCTHARAVFIRRITPWPIEPPLQIWRCPMGASFSSPAAASPIERVINIAAHTPPSISLPDSSFPLIPVKADEQANVDISDYAFDFARSIRVYHIQFSQRRNRDGDCISSDATRLGSYGAQRNYSWSRLSIDQVPPASALPRPLHCASVSFRAVFVDWRDHAGNYGFEGVRY
jgi:hypothetical protein